MYSIRHILMLLVLMFLLGLSTSCYEEILLEQEIPAQDHSVLAFNHISGITDLPNDRIFFTISSTEIESFIVYIHFEKYKQLSFNDIALQNDTINNLGKVQTNYSYPCIGRSDNQTDTFTVEFSALPLLHVTTEKEISDEPKSLSQLYMQYVDPDDGTSQVRQFSTTAGIEIRGATSTRYRKVSYGIELWKNSKGEDYKTGLLDMRSSEDWILDAMYIDDLRMRNKLSFDIWKRIYLADSTVNEASYPGINCRFVELLINNEYLGLYCLNEKLDEHLLGFTFDQFPKGGLIYKAIKWSDGATRFETLENLPPNTFIWDGWEQIYPDHDTCWHPLFELRDFIINSTDNQFEAEIAGFMNLDNLIDYYLFVNLVQGYDNSGKNTFLVRTDYASGFRLLPWDIEATWGLAWNRERNVPSGIVTNNLFDRLIKTNVNRYSEQLEIQWQKYRETIFSDSSIQELVSDNYYLLSKSGAYAREKERWKEFPLDYISEYQYINHWISERLEYLDEYFD